MARRVEVVLIDDIDNSEATETLTFALDGMSYEIDLSEIHAKELRSALGIYVEKGRRIGGRKKAAPAKASSGSKTSDVRQWARENGYDVPERGRLRPDIHEAYEAAQK